MCNPSSSPRCRRRIDPQYDAAIVRMRRTTVRNVAGSWRGRLRRFLRRAFDGEVQIPICLQPHPELRRRFEQLREPERGIGGNFAPSGGGLISGGYEKTGGGAASVLAGAGGGRKPS